MAVQVGDVVPPFVPAQVQLQGPLPVILDAVPVAQRLLVGVVETVTLLALPQVPLTGRVMVLLAEAADEIFPAASLAKAYKVLLPLVVKG